MLGRPVNPDSERALQPWKALCVSRATYYWRKRELRKLLGRSPRRWRELFAAEYGIDLERMV